MLSTFSRTVWSTCRYYCGWISIVGAIVGLVDALMHVGYLRVVRPDYFVGSDPFLSLIDFGMVLFAIVLGLLIGLLTGLCTALSLAVLHLSTVPFFRRNRRRGAWILRIIGIGIITLVGWYLTNTIVAFLAQGADPGTYVRHIFEDQWVKSGIRLDLWGLAVNVIPLSTFAMGGWFVTSPSRVHLPLISDAF